MQAKLAGSKTGFRRVGARLNVPKWNQQRDKYVARALRARARQDEQFRNILLETKRRNLYLLHFDRSGKRSYWGGSVNKTTGQVQGTNQLGKLLMILRDSIAQEQEEEDEGEDEEEDNDGNESG